MAHSFLPDVASAKRYAWFLLNGLKNSGQTDRRIQFQQAVIGLLSPCHNPKLLGFVSGDEELRSKAVIELLIAEATALSKCHEDCLTNPSLRVEYSETLLVLSEIFEYFEEDISGFFRHAGANAFSGEPTGNAEEWKADPVRLH